MPYWPMQAKLPPGDATYKTVQQKDMTFGVEVTISGGLPTTVAGFASVPTLTLVAQIGRAHV